MNIVEILQTQTWLFYTTVVFIGLCVGSFLNVVIYRLPIILDREWSKQCREYLDIEHHASSTSTDENLGLATPRSACPHCGHKITALENVPVLSYLILRGRCSSCRTMISPEYPFVESLTAIISLLVAMKFGVSAHTILALIFSWSLIALTFIDAHTQLLPDDITLPLLWLGISCSLFGLFTGIYSSVMGAISGYLILWCVFKLFKLITGKEGMGYGDFKLLAALGAWVGWEYLPQIILVSSVIGTVLGIISILMKNKERHSTIPFGPYLALAGWVALMYGERINNFYFSLL